MNWAWILFKYLDALIYLCIRFWLAVDSDSGTDESCDYLAASTASPPASGYSVASRMTVGVVCTDSIEKELEEDENEEERVHHLSVGLLFATTLPTADSLAKLKQRKKVSESLV